MIPRKYKKIKRSLICNFHKDSDKVMRNLLTSGNAWYCIYHEVKDFLNPLSVLLPFALAHTIGVNKYDSKKVY